MLLLTHVMKFDAKLGMYLGDANRDITDKAMEIWTRSQAMAMESDMTPDTHLRLTLFLLDQLLVISPGLSFWQDIPFSLAWTQGHYLPEQGWYLLLHSSGTGRPGGHSVKHQGLPTTGSSGAGYAKILRDGTKQEFSR